MITFKNEINILKYDRLLAIRTPVVNLNVKTQGAVIKIEIFNKRDVDC